MHHCEVPVLIQGGMSYLSGGYTHKKMKFCVCRVVCACRSSSCRFLKIFFLNTQEQGMGDGNSFMDVGNRKDSAFLSTVDKIIQHWTQMWVSDAAHDDAIASKVQVFVHLPAPSHCDEYMSVWLLWAPIVFSFARNSLHASIHYESFVHVLRFMKFYALPLSFRRLHVPWPGDL
jgi:hypothetical protein